VIDLDETWSQDTCRLCWRVPATIWPINLPTTSDSVQLDCCWSSSVLSFPASGLTLRVAIGVWVTRCVCVCVCVCREYGQLVLKCPIELPVIEGEGSVVVSPSSRWRGAPSTNTKKSWKEKFGHGSQRDSRPQITMLARTSSNLTDRQCEPLRNKDKQWLESWLGRGQWSNELQDSRHSGRAGATEHGSWKFYIAGAVTR
jgi:hypothetical protein